VSPFAHLHADAVSVLQAWTHPEANQRVLCDQYLAFLHEHPDAMSRTCAEGHLTSSALVMDMSRRHVLLTLHPKVGRWLQLGGHNEEGDESVRGAALRETREESGIIEVSVSAVPLRLDRHPVPCGGRMSEHLDVQFLAVVRDGSEAVMSEESDDLRWFAVDRLPEPVDDSVRALVADALRA
jgi:8-oxo-dGTP pyrophosphatase MutT (NUDIX family)